MIAQSENTPSFRPRLVLGYAESIYAAQACRQLRRLGWEVHLASNTSEVHRLVRALAPEVVVLDAELRDESGWLTCVKLHISHPQQKVIVLTSASNAFLAEMADFVGATLVDRDDGVAALLSQITETAFERQQAEISVVVGS